MGLAARAAVQTGDRSIEIRSLDVPSSLPNDSALLRVELNGVCGSDYSQYLGHLSASGWARYPMVPGHEPLGRVEWIGPDAASRWNVQTGDRVVVEGFVPCYVCEACRSGRTKFCSTRFCYGFVPLAEGSGLSGGMAEYMILEPGSVLHPVSSEMPLEALAFQNALAAGFDWAIRAGGVTPGDRVLVLGCGQRGLATVFVAALAGAEQIIVTGLQTDQYKLDIAQQLGATDVLIAEEADIPAEVTQRTGGRLADVAVEMTPGATGPIIDAIRSVRPEGTIVLAGIKGMKPVKDFVSDHVVLNAQHLVGVTSTSSWATDRSLAALSAHAARLSVIPTRLVQLEKAEDAIRLLGGELGGDIVSVGITP